MFAYTGVISNISHCLLLLQVRHFSTSPASAKLVTVSIIS